MRLLPCVTFQKKWRVDGPQELAQELSYQYPIWFVRTGAFRWATWVWKGHWLVLAVFDLGI